MRPSSRSSESARAAGASRLKFTRLVCVYTALTLFTDISGATMRSCILCIAALAAPSPCAAFYLPGVAPRDYLPGEKVELKVNKLSSTKTQLVR